MNGPTYVKTTGDESAGLKAFAKSRGLTVSNLIRAAITSDAAAHKFPLVLPPTKVGRPSHKGQRHAGANEK